MDCFQTLSKTKTRVQFRRNIAEHDREKKGTSYGKAVVKLPLQLSSTQRLTDSSPIDQDRQEPGLLECR